MATKREQFPDASVPGREKASLQDCPEGFMCPDTSENHISNCNHPSRQLGFFLTKCDALEDKYNAGTFARSLKDILGEDTGSPLKSAVHFSYLYDIDWLLEQYPEKYRDKPMKIVVMEEFPNKCSQHLVGQKQKDEYYKNIFKLKYHVPPHKFGTHHSKMIFLEYNKYLRIVVTTANLEPGHWADKTQMVWVSPVLRRIAGSEKLDSETEYLRSYPDNVLEDVAKCLDKFDFTPIKEYFIASSPNMRSGYAVLDSVLGASLELVPGESESGSPVTCCFTSIKSLKGRWLESYLGPALLRSRAGAPVRAHASDIKLICPTDLRQQTVAREPWIREWMHRWSSDKVGRTNVEPNVKFYVRTSADYERVHWFLMTSANLTKAAWGQERGVRPLSYEAGILHIPKTPLASSQIVLPFDLPPREDKLIF